MKSTDLRIGNWVINHLAEPDDNPQMVYDVLYDSINTMTSEGVPYDMVSPIPLTESILVKCGFKTIPETLKFKEYKNRNVEIHLFEGSIKWAGIDINEESLRIDVKFVHELQNLFLSLYGEELTITL